MLEKRLARQKRITGVLLLLLIVVFLTYFLAFAPVSPLMGDLRAAKSAVPVPAEGIWGMIGFYEKASDNSATYCMMLMFFSMAVYKIVRGVFFPKRRAGGKNSDPLLRYKS